MAGNENIKVLLVLHDLRVGNGIAMCLMNYYQYTVGDRIQIDFLLYRDVASHYMNEVKSMGSNIYILPNFTGNPNRQNNLFIKNIIEKGYDIVHVNTSGYYALSTLKAAKKQGVEIRIYHAHNPIHSKQLGNKTRLKNWIRNRLYVKPGINEANYLLACSKSAGRSAFGEKEFMVLNNAIDTSRYRFDPGWRDNIRQELNLNDSYVVGVVGRIEEQKNPEFLIRVFSELVKTKPNSFLIWAGEGKKQSSVTNMAQQLKVDEKVILLGTRKDANKLYSAMDVFLLPSKFEGLGIVFIEAQASGLTCVGSDQVPEEVEITDLMHRLPLCEDEKYWAKKIIMFSSEEHGRPSYCNLVNNSGYEITKVSNTLKNFYLDSYDKTNLK